MPLVSVVIPTVGRSDLILRAVRSALGQTVDDLEVVIVIDGPDPATREALAVVDDPRVRILQLPENGGQARALNTALRQVTGRWVAFLDDDDEWFPGKLEAQIRVAERVSTPYPLISCRVIVRSEAGDVVWPLRRPDPGEHLSEYLFCQHGFRGGEGIVLPTTLLTTPRVFEHVLFREDMLLHNDADWLLRGADRLGLRVEFVPELEPLAVWNMAEGRQRMSSGRDWRSALRWIRENRKLVTPRAYAGYLLIQASMAASNSGEWRAFWLLAWEATRRGKASIGELCAHVLIWTLPKRVRNRIVVALAGRRGASGEGMPPGIKEPAEL